MDAELVVQGEMLAVIEASGTASDGANPSMKKKASMMCAGGVTTTVSGVISTFAVNGINDDWRRDRVAALNALASKASKFLLPEQCKSLQETANTVRQSMRDASARRASKLQRRAQMLMPPMHGS